MRTELNGKGLALRQFENLEGQLAKQRQSHDKALQDSDHERKAYQEKFNNTEKGLDINFLENLKLKGLNFDLDVKVADYTLLVEQTQRRIKLLNEKSSKVLKDLDTAFVF